MPLRLNEPAMAALAAAIQGKRPCVGRWMAGSGPAMTRRRNAEPFVSFSPLLDERDRRLLAFLQDDSETPLAMLAERLALSPSACSRRIQRLKEGGYIARSAAVLDRRRMGLPTTIFVLLRTAHHAPDWLDRFRAAVLDIPEIVEVHRLTGNFDYILKIALPNVEHYDVIYKRLVSRIELFDVSAYISMETLKADGGIPTAYG